MLRLCTVGYQRDSKGFTGKAGNVAGLIGDASLVWTATARRQAHRLVDSRRNGRRMAMIDLQADIAIKRARHVGLDRNDNRYSAGVGLTYKLDRSWQIKGELRQDWLRSNISGNNYSATTVLLDLRWQK